MPRPNVLLLYTDQQRADTIHAGGNELIHTPHLDALAAQAALFDHAFVNCPVCMPSRMSLLTGRYPAALGICCNGIELPQDVPCVQHLLRPYGYHTANLGKLHFKNHASAFRDHRDPHPPYGFDTLILSDEPGCYDDAYIKWVAGQDPAAVELCRIDTPAPWNGKPVRGHDRTRPSVFPGPEELTHTAFVATQTIEFLRARPSGPFFCIAGFYAPHDPFNPPQRFLDLYDSERMPLPWRTQVHEKFRDITDAQWRQFRAHYYALISHIDDQIGRILAELDRLKLSENTLVIFTSDHGEYLGDHGRLSKGGPEDASARVPLLLRAPGTKQPARRFDQIVETVDLAPTILDYCGVQTPPFMPGRSLKALLEGREYRARESAFIEQRVPHGWAYKAVRTREWLYRLEAGGREELYDLRADPHQLANVAAAPAGEQGLQQMRRVMLGRWFEVESQYPQRTGPY